MSEPFLGQIKLFGFNFAPRGWAFCDGQLLPINQNQALFSLLGTTYGGDGRTTFALPDLRGRAALQFGTGPGLSPLNLGQRSGSETNTMTAQQLAAHTHTFAPPASTVPGNTDVASNHYPAQMPDSNYQTETDSSMALGTSGSTGSSQSVNNMQPHLVINFSIALQGLFPPRN
jgi:microcystin-dependent protein